MWRITQSVVPRPRTAGRIVVAPMSRPKMPSSASIGHSHGHQRERLRQPLQANRNAILDDCRERHWCAKPGRALLDAFPTTHHDQAAFKIGVMYRFDLHEIGVRKAIIREARDVLTTCNLLSAGAISPRTGLPSAGGSRRLA
jgi:hypothetical protein